MSFLSEETEKLYSYQPPLTRQPDFVEFWKETIKQAKSLPLNAKMELYDYPSPHVKVYEITYNVLTKLEFTVGT